MICRIDGKEILKQIRGTNLGAGIGLLYDRKRTERSDFITMLNAPISPLKIKTCIKILVAACFFGHCACCAHPRNVNALTGNVSDCVVAAQNLDIG